MVELLLESLIVWHVPLVVLEDHLRNKARVWDGGCLNPVGEVDVANAFGLVLGLVRAIADFAISRDEGVDVGLLEAE